MRQLVQLLQAPQTKFDRGVKIVSVRYRRFTSCAVHHLFKIAPFRAYLDYRARHGPFSSVGGNGKHSNFKFCAVSCCKMLWPDVSASRIGSFFGNTPQYNASASRLCACFLVTGTSSTHCCLCAAYSMSIGGHFGHSWACTDARVDSVAVAASPAL